MTRVLVIMGGMSEEREVSLRSGKAVAKALKQSGYIVDTLDFNRDTLLQIKNIAPDVVFNALHGKYGEDGAVQGYLDLLGIPYTGSGMESSVIGMNKVLTKKLLTLGNIPTAEYMIINKSDFEKNKEALTAEVVVQLGLPLVIKAAAQGSSIGTFVVKSWDKVGRSIEEACRYGCDVIAEKFIDGIELTASVIGNDEPQVLPLIEITSENEFYDYESKYTPGMCHHIIPARVARDIAARVEEIARDVYTNFGCSGFARVDFIVDRKGNPYVLEINTVPGMTEMSLVPDAARAAGIEFEELVDKIVQFALKK